MSCQDFRNLNQTWGFPYTSEKDAHGTLLKSSLYLPQNHFVGMAKLFPPLKGTKPKHRVFCDKIQSVREFLRLAHHFESGEGPAEEVVCGITKGDGSLQERLPRKIQQYFDTHSYIFVNNQQYYY